jgi:hypothetical protein
VSPFQPPPPFDAGMPSDEYRARCEHFASLRDQFEQRGNRQGIISVFAIALAIAAAALGIFRSAEWFWAAGALLLGFIASYGYHAHLDMLRQRYALLWQVNDEGLHRLARDWSGLPQRASALAGPDHPYAADLDLVGHASLLHLLNMARTPIGQATLQRWILHPAAPEIARRRQPGARELAKMPDFRDGLALYGTEAGHQQHTYEGFADWAESTPYLPEHRWLVWTARILPACTALAVILQLAGAIHVQLWLLGALIGYVISVLIQRGVQEHIEQVTERQSVFGAYANLFALIEAQPFAAPHLRDLQATLGTGSSGAYKSMQRLARIMAFAQLQETQIPRVIVRALFLWQVHVLVALEDWQRRSGAQVRSWLQTIGEMEALAALAALSHDHPAWAFPTLDEAARQIVARDLGHPLLPLGVCVGNDVQLGPPGTFLLLTGSNMSGKSTLLRAIGVNVALAQAGGPCCAQALMLPPVRLATSIRVQDSLEQGVSYFMAELQRLKLVVDAADAAQAAREPLLLFLLDEILHGTNTYERQIAARHIIRYLLDKGALGVVSTHDLTLADAPVLLQAAQLAHFTESFAREDGRLTMSFDYRLRPGLATSTNALKLMEIVGLPLPASDPA